MLFHLLSEPDLNHPLTYTTQPYATHPTLPPHLTHPPTLTPPTLTPPCLSSGAHVEVLPLFNRGWYGGTWALNVEMTFQLTDATSSLLLEVYDKDVADVSCKFSSSSTGARASLTE